MLQREQRNENGCHNSYTLEVKGLTKAYGAHPVLENVSFSLGRGEVLGLLGPNGSGKTTLVKILCGLLRAGKGDVAILDRDYDSGRLDIYRRLGVFLDGEDHFSDLTLHENLTLEARVREIPHVKETVESWLQYFELSERRNRLASECSKGMKKKLGLCIALMHRPELVLLDEPFEGLDPVASLRLLNLLQSYREKGGSVVLTSHTLHLLPGVLDRAGFIVEGQLIEEQGGAIAQANLVQTYRSYYQSPWEPRCPVSWP